MPYSTDLLALGVFLVFATSSNVCGPSEEITSSFPKALTEAFQGLGLR